MKKYAVILGSTVIFHGQRNWYTQMLDRIANQINRGKFDCIIICGGHTNPKSASTEAQLIKQYISKRLNRKIEIKLEQRSITTSQNIEFATKLLDTKNSITVFCYKERAFKTLWSIMHFWFHMNKREIEDYILDMSESYYKKGLTNRHIIQDLINGIKYKNIELRPIGPLIPMDLAAQQIASLLEINSFYDKRLRRRMLDNTKIKFGIK